MTTHLIALLVGFIAGFLVHRKHAAKAASVEQKGKTILDVLKGR
jgi:F0F1-type ATP synthase assembly protein I